LAYDVARAQELRLAAEVESARRRKALYDGHLLFLEDYQNGLDGAQNAIETVLRIRGIDADDTVRASIEKLHARGREARGELADTYLAIALYAKTILVDKPRRVGFPNEVDAVVVDEELARADIALREREAVIVRGLDGLVAFHEGGIDAEDVANLIRVAQAIGIFAIAAN
jgi:hypothetical protein